MRKLLLHTCCAPCLSGANIALAQDDLDITAYYYNPNIHPQIEFFKRIDALKRYTDIKRFNTIIVENYDFDIFESEVVGKPGDRCFNCFRLRLEATADHASRNEFDCFSTTLLLSPYQKHDMIRSAGEEASKKYGIEFYYSYMRPFYRESIKISKEMGLYRQKYCGCYLSKEKKNEQVVIASA